jgi:hypothetical protein
MKIFIMALLLAVPAAVSAQNNQVMNQADVQNMMQQMQKVQECMQSIDQSQLEELQKRSEQASSEIDALCAAGDRAKAQKKAIAFAKEAATFPAMKQMQKCGKLVQGELPGMPTNFEQKDFSETHVCDEK